MVNFSKIYFLFAALTAFNCTKKTINNIPVITRTCENRQHEPPFISITSTAARAIVCIGSNNSIYMGKMGKKFLSKNAINNRKDPPVSQSYNPSKITLDNNTNNDSINFNNADFAGIGKKNNKRPSAKF